MKFLQRVLAAIPVALSVTIAAFFAMQASQRKREAERWRDTATGIRENQVNASLADADAAETQAKFHESEAERIAEKAKAKINKAAKSDETMSDILDRWRAG